MECPQCKGELFICNGKFTTELDTLDIYHEVSLVCTNPKCISYCGTDTANPKTVIKTVRNKVNQE